MENSEVVAIEQRYWQCEICTKTECELEVMVRVEGGERDQGGAEG